METDQNTAPESFAEIGLSEALAQTLNELGYETPTPIQQQTIPLLLAGHDLIGQAQTGTGKTAAFSLPILDRLDLTRGALQALVLTPTRELAIQVAEAIHTYARHLGRIRVTPIYGGDSIQKQISRLRGPMHVVVGTPGRIMDHLRRGTLDFKSLRFVVLDEADEMLRMGFLEDVEWILKQTPEGRQTALFSATMPREVRRITERYLNKPKAVEIKHKTLTVPTVEQHYFHVSEKQKLVVLTQLLETRAAEDGDAILIFTRTKLGAGDLAERLQARGYEAEAMHGGMTQSQRESVVRRMRAGQVEIVVATDVAARGLDIEQIGLVINYDIPNDPESYVHRIGRTGRAGRAGTAILFVAPREERMMREIENYTGQRLTPKKVPTRADVAARRMALFKERILKALEGDELESYLSVVEELAEESGREMAEIAAAAARLAHGDKPLVVSLEPEPEQVSPSEAGMVRLFINAGRQEGIRPSDVVGAIANEADIPGKTIGAIDIYDDFTFVDVPGRYADQVLKNLSGATIRNREINVRLATRQDIGSRGGEGEYGDRRRGGDSFVGKKGGAMKKRSGVPGKRRY
jgi:ATP-dependent RNA helicase DeaD